MNEEVIPTAKALFEKLRAFCNNRDFILGVMCNAPHEDDMKTILEYIEKGKDAAVAYGSYDFKFKNNTQNVIKIVMENTPDTITGRILKIS